jgi:MFS family permease
MQSVAQGWLVLQLSNSPFWLGFVGFAGSLPVLVFALVGGVVADLFDRRRLLLLTQTALMLLAVVLGTLTELRVVAVGHIVVIALASGVMTALTLPTYQAIVRDLVEPEDLMNAIALNSIQFNLSRVIGPTLAGFAVGAIGVAGCFYINAVSFLALIFALRRIRVPQMSGPPRTNSLWEGFLEGVAYVRAQGRILRLLAIVAVISLFGLPYITLLPIFARDILRCGATGLGYLMAASGTGAVLGALILARLGDFRSKGALAVLGGITFGLATFGFALSRTFELSLFFLFMDGWAMVSSAAVVNTLLQTHVPGHVRGRVMSLYTLSFMGLMPVGNLVVGSLAEWLGASWALAVGGIVIVACVGAVAASARDLVRLS